MVNVKELKAGIQLIVNASLVVDLCLLLVQEKIKFGMPYDVYVVVLKNRLVVYLNFGILVLASVLALGLHAHRL